LDSILQGKEESFIEVGLNIALDGLEDLKLSIKGYRVVGWESWSKLGKVVDS
jgi:hypothetical protein